MFGPCVNFTSEKAWSLFTVSLTARTSIHAVKSEIPWKKNEGWKSSKMNGLATIDTVFTSSRRDLFKYAIKKSQNGVRVKISIGSRLHHLGWLSTPVLITPLHVCVLGVCTCVYVSCRGVQYERTVIAELASQQHGLHMYRVTLAIMKLMTSTHRAQGRGQLCSNS